MTARTTAALGAAILMVLGAMPQNAIAQKNKPGTVNWPCAVQWRDGAGDAIRGDGRTNPDGTTAYVNSVAGVTCVVVPPDSGSTTAADLSLYFANNSKRSLVYAEQNGGVYPGYAEFNDKGSLRVKQIATVAEGAARAFVAYTKVGQFLASFEGEADTIADLVAVEPLDACSWRVTFDVTGTEPNGSATMELWEGAGWSRFRGALQMPFAFDVRVTGEKPGCE